MCVVCILFRSHFTLWRSRGILYSMLTPSAALEALLFTSGEPINKNRLSELLEVHVSKIDGIIESLKTELSNRGLALVETSGYVELRTSAESSKYTEKLRKNDLTRDLGKAGLEVLSIILYKNGATRSDIDFVRGVNSLAALRSLLMRGLIETISDSSDKRKLHYIATTDALAHLGVTKAEDLPQYEEMSFSLKKSNDELVDNSAV